MVILCDGMVRSGSTWSFNVALQLLRSYDRNRKAFGTYSENPAVLAAAIKPRFSNLVIKTHALDPLSRGLCATGAIKTIYTWRQPYDAVASCVQMFGLSVPDSIAALRNALRVWSFHRVTNSACIVAYEEIVAEPFAAIERIAAYLGLAIESAQLRGIAEEVSFERVRRYSNSLGELEPSRLAGINGNVFDRATLLHQNHIRNGANGYGCGLLGPARLNKIDAMLREEGFGFLCQPRGTPSEEALGPECEGAAGHA